MKKIIYSPDKCELSQAEINHLRRLLAWLRCENKALYLEKDAHAEVAKELGGDLANHYVDSVEKAFNKWPKYVHDAVRALGKSIQKLDGEVLNAEFSEQREITLSED